MTTFQFTSTVELFEDNLWFYHFLIPNDVSEAFLNLPTCRRVLCKINNSDGFNCALMPDGLGQYFINLPQPIRKQLNLNQHQEIDVFLAPDPSEYGMPMPEELEEFLRQDPVSDTAFKSLTPGKQRNLIYIVNSVKSSSIKLRRASVIANHLTSQAKLDFKILNQELKAANQRAKDLG